MAGVHGHEGHERRRSYARVRASSPGPRSAPQMQHGAGFAWCGSFAAFGMRDGRPRRLSADVSMGPSFGLRCPVKQNIRYVYNVVNVPSCKLPAVSGFRCETGRMQSSHGPAPIHCARCGSNQITANKAGFRGGSALLGFALFGPLVGLASGVNGSNKITITCLACGNTWKPGKAGAGYQRAGARSGGCGTLMIVLGCAFGGCMVLGTIGRAVQGDKPRSDRGSLNATTPGENVVYADFDAGSAPTTPKQTPPKKKPTPKAAPPPSASTGPGF